MIIHIVTTVKTMIIVIVIVIMMIMKCQNDHDKVQMMAIKTIHIFTKATQ
jgi:uncharacterized lipoprotein NlpE involved in copper resistance